MTDPSTSWLIHHIQQNTELKSLWFSDENSLHHINNLSGEFNRLCLVTNRWDIAEQAKSQGVHTEFSDFDLTHHEDEGFDIIFYRISKEKAVVHHLLNQAARLLKPGGRLLLSGQKNEGIKTYIEKACSLFGCEKKIQKNGMSYSSEVIKQQKSTVALADENYSQLRACLEINNLAVFSKPGQFGWDKIDQGSKFLIDELKKIYSLHNYNFNSCLDLGCGYGYLTIASQFLGCKNYTLTDNNAAALLTAKKNCAELGIPSQVVASDAGKQLHNRFSLILCNPPFHQGFSVDGDLTQKFLHSAQQLLTQEGVAYFVVNQFIPLEKLAQPFFREVKLIAQNKSFSLLKLANN